MLYSICYIISKPRLYYTEIFVMLGRRFAAALLPRLFGTNPRPHHKGATGRVRTETKDFRVQFYAIANLDKKSHVTVTMIYAL